MKTTHWITAMVAVGLVSAGVAGAGDAPTVEEQVNGLVEMCAASESARVARQAEKPLYVRLGEDEGVHALTTEVVRLHKENDAINHMFTHVDSERLAKNVADFAAAGTGGPQNYSGRTMPAAHSNLHLTDADFLSAGGDIVTAMTTLGYGENEINEFVCILVSLKDQVVLD